MKFYGAQKQENNDHMVDELGYNNSIWLIVEQVSVV